MTVPSPGITAAACLQRLFLLSFCYIVTKTDIRDFVKLFDECIADPPKFLTEVLGVNTWPKQDEIIRATFKYRSVAVRSCHGSGKTYAAAGLVLAWLYLHEPGSALVITTSSSWEQVEQGLWREIRNLVGQSKWPFPKPNLASIQMPTGSRAFGISTNDPSNWHGFHNRHVLVVVDEAAAISAEVFSALHGIKSSGSVHVLYLMNPTEATGPSVDLFDDPRTHKIVIDGFYTPNMEGIHLFDDVDLNNAERDPDWEHNLLALSEEELEWCVPGYEELITRISIRDTYEETIREYGSLKPEAVDWWARVRGEFPKDVQSQLIKPEWVDRAHTNVIKARDTVTVIGIDVAGPGSDMTAICARNGFKIIEERAWPDPDPYDKIVSVIGDPRPNMWLHVDAVAIGWGLCTALLRAGYLVKPCNAKESAQDNTRFAMAKAEWYWNLRELFRGDESGEPLIGGPIHPVTRQQLLTIRWDQKGPHGTVRIESKEDMKKRGLQSPDRAEAMMLCFAGGPYNIATRQLVYTNDVVSSGAANESSLTGPGWESKLNADKPMWEMENVTMKQAPGPLPKAVSRWIETSEQHKLARKNINRHAVRRLMQPEKTALYDSSGKFLGHRQVSLDPIELRRLTTLLESAD